MDREEQFINLVCDYLKLPVEKVISKCRKHEYCEARQMISYLLKLHTKLSLQKIADKIHYISHASVLRDVKQVSNFLEIDKSFKTKYNPLLIKAERLVWMLNKDRRANEPGYKFEQGDICWFWNDFSCCVFPIIGFFDKSCFNEDMIERFIAIEYPKNTFDHCVYAGQSILPERFKGQLMKPIIVPVPTKHVFPLPEKINV